MSQQLSPNIVEAALGLGYTIEDIRCPNITQIYQQSYGVIKGMSQAQKDFYLNKKLNIYLGRRDKIIRQATQQMKRKQNKQNQKNKNSFNPKLVDIYNQYQKRYHNKKRYLETRQRGLQSSKLSRKQHSKDSFDLQRISKSSNKSMRNKISSKNSIRSNSSSKGSFCYKGKSSQLKVSLVRQKQKQIMEYKKQLLNQKLIQDHHKFLKAEQNALKKSRKIKMQSEISKTIVADNKLKIERQKQQYNQNHLQNLKYKINRNQYVRSKILTSGNHGKDMQIYFVQSVHNQIQRTKTSNLKSRYEEKLRISQNRQHQYQALQKFSIDLNRKAKSQKIHQIKQKNQIKEKQITNFKHQMLIYEQNKLDQAELLRKQELQKKKLFTLDYKLQKEFVDRNRHSIELSRNIKNNLKTRQKQRKNIQEIQLNKVKQNLNKQQNYFQKIVGARKARSSSNNNQRVHFNSFNF